jgi:hypothetical protein
VFTDGVTEAANSISEVGEERLLELAAALRKRDAAETKDRLLESVAAFTGGSKEDDATLVVLAARRQATKTIACPRAYSPIQLSVRSNSNSARGPSPDSFKIPVLFSASLRPAR